ncbi:MAG: hypothetical protein AAF798_04530 [Bacteroidota bacterium]
MRRLDLDRLNKEINGISSTRAAFYREAIIVGLKRQGHESGIDLEVSGEFDETFSVVWGKDITSTELASWKDENQIANFAAVGLSVLLVIELLNIVSFE